MRVLCKRCMKVHTIPKIDEKTFKCKCGASPFIWEENQEIVKHLKNIIKQERK